MFLESDVMGEEYTYRSYGQWKCFASILCGCIPISNTENDEVHALKRSSGMAKGAQRPNQLLGASFTSF